MDTSITLGCFRMAHIQEARSPLGKLDDPTASDERSLINHFSRVRRTAVYIWLVMYPVFLLHISSFNRLQWEKRSWFANSKFRIKTKHKSSPIQLDKHYWLKEVLLDMFQDSQAQLTFFQLSYLTLSWLLNLAVLRRSIRIWHSSSFMDETEAVGKFTGSEGYEILITVKNITVIRMFVLQVIKLLIQIFLWH